jgi:cell division protease FtsH
MALPEEDRTVTTRSKFADQLAFALGGRAAEDLVFGDMTTGAANDLERVTEMARSMVTRYGMSDKLGPMTFGQKEELVFLGKDIGEQRDYSEAIAEQIDAEVRDIVYTAYQRALDVLKDHQEQLEAVAKMLLEVETLDADEFVAVIEGRLQPEDSDTSGGTPPSKQKASVGKERSSSTQPNPKLDMPPRPAPA